MICKINFLTLGLILRSYSPSKFFRSRENAEIRLEIFKNFRKLKIYVKFFIYSMPKNSARATFFFFFYRYAGIKNQHFAELDKTHKYLKLLLVLHWYICFKKLRSYRVYKSEAEGHHNATGLTPFTVNIPNVCMIFYKVWISASRISCNSEMQVGASGISSLCVSLIFLQLVHRNAVSLTQRTDKSWLHFFSVYIKFN